MDDSLAFFVVFGQGPGTDALRIARAKTRTAICIEDIAGFRLVEYGPDFQAFAQFPAAAMKHCAPAQNLRRFALVFGALGEKVDCFLAGHFQPDSFEGCVHAKELRVDPLSFSDPRGLGRIEIRSRRALPKAANVSLWSIVGPGAVADHLGKQIYVIVSFAGHGLANLVQHGQEFWATIHFLNFKISDLNSAEPSGPQLRSLPKPETPA